MADNTHKERYARWAAAHPERVKDYNRAWQPRGNQSLPVGMVSLSPMQVRSIRRKLNAGCSRKELALEYGCSYNTIRRIDDGVTYLAQEYQIEP
jgi:hypothetical protein